MRYKLLALDIDGTLTNSQKRITPKTLEALEQLQEKGVKVILASGRPLPGLEKFADELRLKEHGGYLLCFNGGRIIDYKTGKAVCDHFLPQERLPALADAAKEYGVALMSYEGREVITEMPEDEYICYEAKINGLKVRKIENFKEYVTFPVNKCLMMVDGEYLAKVEEKMKQRFPDLMFYRSEPFFLEIMPQGIDKATSLQQLLDLLGYQREDLACCGDGFNDLTMIQFAGLGVAMENAQEPVKQAADFITHSNDMDGIAHMISVCFQ